MTRTLPWGLSTAAWTLLGVVVVGGILAVGLGYPEYLILGLAAAIAGVVCLRWPFAFAMITLIVVLGAYVIEGVLGSVGSPADELVIVVSLVVFTTRRILVDRAVVIPGGFFWFIVFAAFGVMSALVADVGTSLMLQAGFLATKGILLAFAFAQLNWTPARIHTLTRLGAAAAVLMVLTGLFNLLAPHVWSSIVGAPLLSPTLGIYPLSGLFAHPAAFGRICAVLAVGILSYRYVVSRHWFTLVLFYLITAMAFLSFRVKTLVGLIVTLGVMTPRLARPAVVFGLLALAPLVLMIAGPPIWELVSSDLNTYIFNESARQQLTVGSVIVANNHLPFGAGFSRFGSFLAAEFYSPEYRMLGWATVYGLGEGEFGQYLLDTQWPAILGEAGWFGAAAFAFGIIGMVVSLVKRVGPGEPPIIRWVRVAGISWIILLLIESIAAPVFVSPPSYPFMFLAAGIIAAVRFDSRGNSAFPAPVDLGAGAQRERLMARPLPVR